MADQPSRLQKELDRFIDTRLERIAWPMVGIVISQTPSRYAVSVRLRDYEDIILNDIPVITSYIGKTPEINETGHWALPNIGNLVVIMFTNGSWDDPIIIGQLYNDIDKVPFIKRDPNPFGHGPKRDLKLDGSDDYHIRHTSGTNLTIDKQGNFTLDHKTNAHVTIDNSGNVLVHSAENSNAAISVADGTDRKVHLVIKGGNIFVSGKHLYLQNPRGPNIARVGDKVSCPAGIGVIVTGAETASCGDTPDTLPELGD